MYPANFEYHVPATVTEALAFLAADEDAKILAGGHSLIPLMKQRLAAPAALIDLRQIKSLVGVSLDDDSLIVGSMTSHAEVAASVKVGDVLPSIAGLAAGIGDAQVRNRGTIGGSLVHADPGADYPALVLALNAQMHCSGPGGERVIAAEDWFEDIMTSAISRDELLTSIRFPLPAPAGASAYAKHPHPASGLSQVGVALSAELDRAGLIASARIGVTGLAEIPYRARVAEEALNEREPSAQTMDQAAECLTDGIEVRGDTFSSRSHRLDLLRDRFASAFACVFGTQDL